MENSQLANTSTRLLLSNLSQNDKAKQIVGFSKSTQKMVHCHYSKTNSDKLSAFSLFGSRQTCANVHLRVVCTDKSPLVFNTSLQILFARSTACTSVPPVYLPKLASNVYAS
ncbi:hypothetical protein J6590_005059 [Homalodisca vitripennis]|nr:hypothetical protein J6590_005059 [Homalodisca vitripennis]